MAVEVEAFFFSTENMPLHDRRHDVPRQYPNVM